MHRETEQTTVRVIRLWSRRAVPAGGVRVEAWRTCSGRGDDRLPSFCMPNGTSGAGGHVGAGDHDRPGTGVAPFRAFLEGEAGDGARPGTTGYFSEISERSGLFCYRDQFHACGKDGVLTRD